MPCLASYVVRHGDGRLDLVRCGRCRYCRVRRKQSWLGRLRLEAAEYKASRFLTLTYADDPGRLDIRDLQLFFKRYRYYYGECRYFAVGEYGSINGRGHWHAIVFGHAPERIGHWKDNKAWTAGYSYDGEANIKSIGYVAGYVLKDQPMRQKLGYVQRDGYLMRCSTRPAIGSAALERMAAAAAVHGLYEWPTSFSVGGRRYPLCDGGLRVFQRAYLESGGLPPVVRSPEQRDFEARWELSDRGTRIAAERRSQILQVRDLGLDRFGTKKSHGKQKI